MLGVLSVWLLYQSRRPPPTRLYIKQTWFNGSSHRVDDVSSGVDHQLVLVLVYDQVEDEVERVLVDG